MASSRTPRLLTLSITLLTATLCCAAGQNARPAPGKARAIPATFTLERNSENVLYVRQGNARHLFYGTDEHSVPRAGGWSLRFTPFRGDSGDISVFHDKALTARFPLKTLHDTWPFDDKYWRGADTTEYLQSAHAFANQMRYLDRRGNVPVSLDEALPTATGWIGVLSWKLVIYAGEPVGAQHLIYIPASATPIIKPVHLMDTYAPSGQPRLISYTESGGKVAVPLLWECLKEGEDACQLTVLGTEGQRKRRWMPLPASTRPGFLLGDRWLICTDPNSYMRINVADLQQRTFRPLLVLPQAKNEYHTAVVYDKDDATQTLLITITIQGNAVSKVQNDNYLLSVPTGKRTSLPLAWKNHNIYLWRGHIFVQSGSAETFQGFTVYDIHTLKQVQRITLPLLNSKQKG